MALPSSQSARLGGIFGSVILLLCFAISAALAAPPAQLPAAPQKKAAPDYALIYGTVWGPNNTPAAGVPITIRRAQDKKPKWELVSDRQGEFAQRVPPGKQDYIIQANIKVPKGQPKPEVTVQIDNDERKDVGLHLTAQGPNQK